MDFVTKKVHIFNFNCLWILTSLPLLQSYKIVSLKHKPINLCSVTVFQFLHKNSICTTCSIAEYAYTTRINERIDVYSFGVVLLELVTGKEPNGKDGDLNLAEWAWKHHGESDSMVGVCDPEIKDSDTYMEEMSTMFKLGLICTSTLPSSRPSMKDVLEILRRCNPMDELPEEMKEGRDEFDVAPLLKRERSVTGPNENEGVLVSQV